MATSAGFRLQDWNRVRNFLECATDTGNAVFCLPRQGPLGAPFSAGPRDWKRISGWKY